MRKSVQHIKCKTCMKSVFLWMKKINQRDLSVLTTKREIKRKKIQRVKRTRGKKSAESVYANNKTLLLRK